ncbi:hypothetical protein ACIGW7_40095 [Streptomyces sp. NPDC053253]|uniref:hypothetical protein n=1 Tax=Streptomyces sp. NPDC053253 TaxID=3365699 RepID=UPI0037D144E6
MTDKDQSEPAWDTPEYRLIGLERIASSIPEEDEGAGAFLSATVAFIGDGDTVREAEVFQRAAEYFKAHPELAVQSAHWTTFPDADGGERFQLELSVVPPGWIRPEDARRIYPRAKR